MNLSSSQIIGIIVVILVLYLIYTKFSGSKEEPDSYEGVYQAGDITIVVVKTADGYDVISGASDSAFTPAPDAKVVSKFHKDADGKLIGMGGDYVISLGTTTNSININGVDVPLVKLDNAAWRNAKSKVLSNDPFIGYWKKYDTHRPRNPQNFSQFVIKPKEGNEMQTEGGDRFFFVERLYDPDNVYRVTLANGIGRTKNILPLGYFNRNGNKLVYIKNPITWIKEVNKAPAVNISGVNILYNDPSNMNSRPILASSLEDAKSKLNGENSIIIDKTNPDQPVYYAYTYETNYEQQSLIPTNDVEFYHIDYTGLSQLDTMQEESSLIYNPTDDTLSNAANNEIDNTYLRFKGKDTDSTNTQNQNIENPDIENPDYT